MLPVKHLHHTQTPVPNSVAHLAVKNRTAAIPIPMPIPTNMTLLNVFI